MTRSVGAPKVLMVLTSHRLDCFRLAMAMLRATGSLEKFDRVVLLLNGVVGRHRAFVDDLVRSTSTVAWDVISGPRGKGPLVASLQNECIRRYPGSLYFKIDEDVFVSDGWVEKLTMAYLAYRENQGLALITPVIPNNGTGFHFLLNAMPALRIEYERRFQQPVVPDCNGPVWINPGIAEWITRRFLDLRMANAELEQWVTASGARYEMFARRFSINCIVYDYRHWQDLGGIPDEEEPAWGQWIPEHGRFNVLVTDTLVHHYSFFVQQEWLDRSSLLEDIRMANLPETLPARTVRRYYAPRIARVVKQIPGIARRRLGLET